MRAQRSESEFEREAALLTLRGAERALRRAQDAESLHAVYVVEAAVEAQFSGYALYPEMVGLGRA